MYVIYPAVEVVDESYLALIAKENATPSATGLSPSPRVSVPSSPAPPTFHDTRPEQERAELEIARQNAAEDAHVPVIPKLTQLQPADDPCAEEPDSLYAPPTFEPTLPDLVPALLTQGQFHAPGLPRTRPDLSTAVSPRSYSGKVLTEIPMANTETSTLEPGGRRPPVLIRDMKHPQLNEYIKGQQQITFKVVKGGRDIISFIVFCICTYIGITFQSTRIRMSRSHT